MATSKLRWLSWAALLAAAAVIPACDAKGAGNNVNPGNTSALWVPVNGATAGGYGANGNAPLLWRDANLGPIGGGGVGSDLTYGTAFPTIYPPGDPNENRPVYTRTPYNSGEENNIIGAVQAYRQTYLAGQVGQGGQGGVGGGQNIQTLPLLLLSDNLRAICRARCRDLAMGFATAGQTLNARMMAAKLVFTNEVEYYATGADYAAAYAAMGAGAKTRSLAGGWYGGGYATAPPYWGLVFCDSTKPTGP